MKKLILALLFLASPALADFAGTGFSGPPFRHGTLTNEKYCTYSTADGIVCNSEGGAGVGDNLGDATADNVAALFSGSGDYLKSDGTRGTPTGSGTVNGPATATEDNIVTWGADNATLKDSGHKLSEYAPLVSPVFTTPTLGVAAATSVNKVAITAPATSATLTIANGKTLTASNTLTFSGTDGSTLAIGTGGTLGTGAYATIASYATLANPTFTGVPAAPTAAADTNTTQIATTAYVIGQGYAKLVSPSFTTPTLGAASATTIDTGQGANELYDMDQNVTTTSDVTFGVVTAGSFVSTALDNTRGVTVPNTADPTTTNLAAGKIWVTDNCVRVRNNDNTVTFSAGCQVETFSFGLDNVVDGDDILLVKVPRAWTITKVDCYASTDNVIGVLQECASDNVASCTDVDDTDWTVTNAVTGFSISSGFENPGIASGAWLKWLTTSEGTTNSNKLSCTVQYRE